MTWITEPLTAPRRKAWGCFRRRGPSLEGGISMFHPQVISRFDGPITHQGVLLPTWPLCVHEFGGADTGRIYRRTVSLRKFARGKLPHELRVRPAKLSTHEVFRRVCQHPTDPIYRPVLNNCETFAREIADGEPRSKQAELALLGAVAGVVIVVAATKRPKLGVLLACAAGLAGIGLLLSRASTTAGTRPLSSAFMQHEQWARRRA
jgi:hypothetical protein